MALTREQMIASIERAKQLVADAKAKQAQKLADTEAARMKALNLITHTEVPSAPTPVSCNRRDDLERRAKECYRSWLLRQKLLSDWCSRYWQDYNLASYPLQSD